MNFENVEQVVYLGPQSSFCEIAKDKFVQKYNISAYSMGLSTIKQIVEYVDKNSNVLGVLPVENTLDGTIREGLDNLITTKNENIKILSETIIPQNYCLLSKTTELYSITGVIGSPIMLGQCHKFIENELPLNLNIVEATSSYEAARLLDGYNLTYSSIGTEKTAQTFNLNILKSNINDDKYNYTRFILIGDYNTELTGDDKTTIALSCKDRPGALVELLNVFNNKKINISYISSHPSRFSLDEHILIINLDGHYNDANIVSAIEDVKNYTKMFRCLGSYEKCKFSQDILTTQL